MNFETIQAHVEAWAKERNINNVHAQTVKLGEEYGELCAAILKQDFSKTVDGLGDCLVVLTILADILGLDIKECYRVAWQEIENRKGKTKGGVFVKDEGN